MKAVFWLQRKYPVYVSSNQASLCSSHISMFRAVLYFFFGDFKVYLGNVFLKGLVKFMEIGILKIWCCFKIRI